MSSDTVQQIKDRLNIVDVVGQYVKLRKAGQNFVARCPFHNEKTPSFNVSPSRNAYYCFGCGEKGDAFTFVEHFEGVDFVGALKILGDRAGVKVVFSKDHKEKRDAREKLLEILEVATNFFETNLKTDTRATAYLKSRGLSEKTISLWRLGYVKGQWRLLYEHLKGVGYTDADIEAAGLIKKKEKGEGPVRRSESGGGYYDRFRGRIMFPITDPASRVIAFTGRIFPDKDDTAKYVNSPETGLYSKSHVLYGYDKAKFAIRKYDFSILVEGQMDTLMSFQSGYTNTVAVSGTALTRDQLTLLNRLSGNIVMAFDADTAGAASAGKSAALALSMGMDVKVAALPSGSDPADLVQSGKTEWKKAVKESQHIIDFYLDRIFETERDMRKRRLSVTRRVLPFVALVSNKVDRAHFVSEIADRLGVPEEAVRDELTKVPTDTLLDTSIREDVAPGSLRDVSSRVGKVKEPEAPPDRKDRIEALLVHLLPKSEKRDEHERALRRAIGVRRYRELVSGKNVLSEADLFALEIRMPHGVDSDREIEDLLLNLEKEHLEEACRTLAFDMRRAENERDWKYIERIVRELKKKTDRLAEIKAVLYST